jgi:nicotinate-nucleotide adenylyltransferase
MNHFNQVHLSRIGIFGGTFDPPHMGHLVAAEEIRQDFSLQKVFFVPSARPPHKLALPLTEAARRLEMISLATRDNPDFAVSDMEIQRPGPSYTVDTIGEFKKMYGADLEVYFIMGADSLFEIRTWKDPERLFHLCKVIVASRPGFSLEQMDADLRNRIILANTTNIDISSTDIRRRVKEDKSIRYYVPDQVEAYIRSKHLYR